MKKLLLLSAVLSIAFLGYTQKIKINAEIDKFTKEKRVESNRIEIRGSYFNSLDVSLRSVGNNYFIRFSGNGQGKGVIGGNDKLIFLLDNDSTVIILPTGLQTSGIDWYHHQYFINYDQIEKLGSHNLKSIRKYYDSNYVDIEIPEKKSGTLKELCLAFLKVK